MTHPRYPLLYQVNTRVFLPRLSRQLGRRATLRDIPDATLDRWAEQGFDWIWLLSVWQTGLAAQRVSRTNLDWRREFEHTLPDLTDEDIPGSGFAITGYDVHRDLGGDAELARLRERMKRRGLRLMLDFVPNHMALDHPWFEEHPEYFIVGTEQDLAREPQNYTRVPRSDGEMILAYGRDPYFSGWPDTLQLNYANPAVQAAMRDVLAKISDQCDGLRCDMAMLVLPDVFERTWGMRPQPFWPRAIERVRRRHPHFRFMAEVYWDLEWEMQQQGFRYAYDKRLYDRLCDRHAQPIRGHLGAGLDYQDKLARFLENHDEPRAAATFPPDVHRAAAVLSFLSPGLRFLHEGQLEGFQVRISPHLNRGPDEPTNAAIQSFYEALLKLLKRETSRNGNWKLLECTPAWEGNGTHEAFVVSCWEGASNDRLVVAVNYADHPSQSHARLPFADLAGKRWRLTDSLQADASYEWQGDDLVGRGLYLDMQPWQASVFSLAEMPVQVG